MAYIIRFARRRGDRLGVTGSATGCTKVPLALLGVLDRTVTNLTFPTYTTFSAMLSELSSRCQLPH